MFDALSGHMANAAGFTMESAANTVTMEANMRGGAGIDDS